MMVSWRSRAGDSSRPGNRCACCRSRYEAFQEIGETEPCEPCHRPAGESAKSVGWGLAGYGADYRKPIPADDMRGCASVLSQSTRDQSDLCARKLRTTAFARFLHTSDPEKFWREYPFDVSPVSDDRPFFFYTVQPRDLLRFWNTMKSRRTTRSIALFRSCSRYWPSVCLATLVILALPPLLLKARLPVEGRLRSSCCISSVWARATS